MRPKRLELHGFTAFREPTVVDFDGADLFALTGPTGSGKSSLIDGMVFALYGVVPRYGDKRTVEPVISLGKLEARVRFDFTIGDDDFTAARVVRRTKTGASTAEARLEGGSEEIVGADEVTVAVEQLLGLGFDHFTKCVVLPQGEFAAFLHDRPAKRQELLRELLDLVVYGRMRELANQRRAAAEGEVKVLSAQLEELAAATPEAEQEAAERLQILEELRDEIEQADPELASLREEAADRTKEAVAAHDSVALLEQIAVPGDVDALAAGLTESEQAVSAAEEEATVAHERVAKTEEDRAQLPAAAELERLIDAHQRLAGEREAVAALQPNLDAAKKLAAGTAEEAAKAEQALTEARRAADEVRRDHAAHALAASLHVGEPCPVCRRPVDQLPVGEAPPALEETDRAVAAAEQHRASAAAGAGEADRALTALRSRADELAARIEELEATLAGQPAATETVAARARVAEADEGVKAARVQEAAARQVLEEARGRRQQATEEVEGARRLFDQARDQLAALGPPLPDRVDLAADWKALIAWAQSTAGELKGVATEAERLAEEVRTELTEREAGMVERLRAHGLEPGDRPIRDVCVAAVADATQQVAAVRRARQRAGQLRSDIEHRQKGAEVAQALGRHLSATGFEAWLLEEALAALVVGANQLLTELSGSAYSLRVRKRDFEVVDHSNADERRPVRTLSGGETFLVSLSLALSLAEQLAALSVHGGTRLESIFLDEGFGTLDGETLDTVAGVIHELGASGRTVGLVTHVRELAEQVPVRFEVSKGPATATVQRIEA